MNILARFSSRVLWTSVLAAAVGACSVPSETGYDTDPDFEAPAVDWGSIGGTVVDGSGTAIEGAHVVVSPHGYESTTDSAGAFVISRLSPGSYAVIGAAPGMLNDEVSDVAVTAGAQVETTLTLTSEEEVNGFARITVFGPDGEPYPGATVTVEGGATTTADSTGLAVLEGVGSAPVDLVVAGVDDATWTRTLAGVTVPSPGGYQATVTLSGRAASDANYVGSAQCSGCHSGHGTDWSATAHGNALADTVDGDLLALFTATTVVTLPAGTATLHLVGSTPTVTIAGTVDGPREFPVAGLIGDPSHGSVPWTELGDQAYPLPVGWVPADDNFGDWPEAAAQLVAFEPERWLDSGGAFTFAVSERPDPGQSADALCFACHSTGSTVTPRGDGGVDLVAVSGTEPRWIEGDVGCERCHGPGSSHVDASFATKPWHITRPDRLDADRANEVCAQCHSATEGVGSQLPWPWSSTAGSFHPGKVLADHGSSVADLWPSGAASEWRSQADELMQSAHGPTGLYTLRCFDCHDPHGGEVDADDAPLPAMLRQASTDNTLCSSCHLGMTWNHKQSSMEEHSGHFGYEPDGETMKGRCTACHMPKTAALLSFRDSSGAGDLSSHRFTSFPPSDALDAFDAASTDTLPIGGFPTYGCPDCHAYNDWRVTQSGGTFFGATGDPTLRATHDAFQTAFEGKFP